MPELPRLPSPSDMPWRSLRAASRLAIRRGVDLRVEGLEQLPATGPVIVAARHYHHLIDGEALLAAIPRPIHLMVALDWATGGAARAGLAAACRSARWPAVVRPDSPFAGDAAERRRALLTATREALQLLREGRVLVVFPEGYPNIDPNPTPKSAERPFLPMQPGFVRLAALARREGIDTLIVPAGFAYEPGERWRVTLRFGAPVALAPGADVEAVRRQVEVEIIRLST